MAKKNIIDRLLATDADSETLKATRAQKKAARIVEKAQEEAEKIVEKATLFNSELKTHLETELNNITNQLSNVLNSQAQQSLTEAMNSYSSQMQLAAKTTRKTIEEQLLQEQAKISSQLEAFYESQKQLFQDSVIKRANELAKENFGSVLTQAQHEKLITKALQKAKEEGLFKNLAEEKDNEFDK